MFLINDTLQTVQNVRQGTCVREGRRVRLRRTVLLAATALEGRSRDRFKNYYYTNSSDHINNWIIRALIIPMISYLIS